MAARTSGFRPSNTTSRGAYSAGKESTNEMVYGLRDADPGTVTTTRGSFKRSWYRYAEAFFRCIGLQSINTFLPWGQEAEFPKIAIERNRKTVLIKLFLHIPPLAGCIALLVLTFMTTILQPNSAFSILQFAAKLHEILMQASIGAILLSHVRYEITKNGQLPFGSLFAPAQISSIGYIWSPEMIGTIKSTGMSGLRKFALVLHIIFAIVLAAAVGPSSAILVIPRPINPLFGQCLVTLPTPVDTLYPSRLTSDTPGKSDFAAVSRLYENIYTQNPALLTTGDTIEASLGASLFNTISSRILNLYENYYTSVPLQVAADALVACSSVLRTTRRTHVVLNIPQPFVSIDSCRVMPIIDMDSSSQLIATQGSLGLEDYVELNITLGECNDSYKNTNKSHILWVAPPQNYNSLASIFAVVAPGLNHVGTGVPWYWVCPTAASWLPAIVNMSEFNQVQTYVTDETLKGMYSSPKTPGIISIDPLWAYNATANATPLNSSIGSPILSELLDLTYSFSGDDDNEPWDGINISAPFISPLVVNGIISTAMSSALTVNAINVTYADTASREIEKISPQGIWMPNITSNPQLILGNESTQSKFLTEVAAEEVKLLAEPDPNRTFVIHVFGKSLIGYAFETVPVFLATTVVCIYCLYILISIVISVIIGISSSSWDCDSLPPTKSMSCDLTPILINMGLGPYSS